MDPSRALKQLSIYFSGLIAFGVLVKYALIPDRLAVPREFPFDGLVKELGGVEVNKVCLFASMFSRDTHQFHFSNARKR